LRISGFASLMEATASPFIRLKIPQDLEPACVPDHILRIKRL
jgi:hypothetical protein